MAAAADAFSGLPKGTLIQMPQNKARLLSQRKLKQKSALKDLHDHFSGQGFRFYPQRVRMFTYLGEDGDKMIPSVLGIVPSFVPVTAADTKHVGP